MGHAGPPLLHRSMEHVLSKLVRQTNHHRAAKVVPAGVDSQSEACVAISQGTRTAGGPSWHTEAKIPEHAAIVAPARRQSRTRPVLPEFHPAAELTTTKGTGVRQIENQRRCAWR
mmetsp:Transcript_40743/g.71666  ORF Transcript_40743/g.71666 Transcript_40743/m.71666 type:complete len:115 (+) Transcript_40743:449-793(+)